MLNCKIDKKLYWILNSNCGNLHSTFFFTVKKEANGLQLHGMLQKVHQEQISCLLIIQGSIDCPLLPWRSDVLHQSAKYRPKSELNNDLRIYKTHIIKIKMQLIWNRERHFTHPKKSRITHCNEQMIKYILKIYSLYFCNCNDVEQISSIHFPLL